MSETRNSVGPGRPGMERRGFLAAAGAALAAGLLPGEARAQQAAAGGPPARPDPLAVKSNVAVAQAQPKKPWSMPGPFPGVVAEVHLPGATRDLQPVPGTGRRMLEAGLRALTGEKDPRDALRRFVTPGERVGIKFNPVGHRVSGTTPEVIGALVDLLERAGIPRRDMLVWHRFNDEWAQAYKPEEAHPGVEAYLLNWFIPRDGRNTPGGFERWDESVFYEADVSLPDEQNYLEEMFHGGTRSEFPLILTRSGAQGGVDKVINVPSLKHHGSCFITLALKNLAFGSTTNCPRGHLFIERYIPEVCAFPPLRDKAVLHVLDGLRGQYDRGPAPAPQFVWPHERLYLASDPVALDSVGFDVLLARQLEAGRLTPDKAEEKRRRHYGLAVAENLGLGVHRGRPIERRAARLARPGGGGR